MVPRMMNRIALLACAGLILASCAPRGPDALVVVTRTAPTTQDALAKSSWGWLAARGPVLVQVFGSPTAQPSAAFAEDLAAVLRAPPYEAPAAFTTRPAAAGSTETRLVFAFGVPVAVDGAVLCRLGAPDGPLPGENPAEGGTVLHAAFCTGPERITEARVTGPAVADARDPAFVDMTRAALRALVPLRDREQDHDDPAPCFGALC